MAIGKAVDGVDCDLESLVEVGLSHGIGVDHALKRVPQDAVAALDETNAPMGLCGDDVQQDATALEEGSEFTSEVAALINPKIVGKAIRLYPRPSKGFLGGLWGHILKADRLMQERRLVDDTQDRVGNLGQVLAVEHVGLEVVVELTQVGDWHRRGSWLLLSCCAHAAITLQVLHCCHHVLGDGALPSEKAYQLLLSWVTEIPV